MDLETNPGPAGASTPLNLEPVPVEPVKPVSVVDKVNLNKSTESSSQIYK